jgi:ABC-type antimicrobial peptide transport system permease subunit
MGFTRGSFTLPRMNAHLLVIVAAALTTVVAAALATALATFGGQALPRAVRQDLTGASGTTMVIRGQVTAAQAAQYSATLPRQVSAAVDHVPFGFYQADWSDPLGFVPGSLPAAPASAGNTPITEAAALGALTAHAVLTSGHWPGAPVSGQPIPAALPATAAALLHLSDGDVLRMTDRVSGHAVRFVVTGLYRPRQVSGASAEYWGLDDVALSGSSTASGFTTYGPLTVQPAAFAGALTAYSGSWLAQPQVTSIPADQLTTVAANVNVLQQSLQNALALPSLTLTTSLPAVLHGTASDLDVARSLLAICAVLLFLLAAAALLAVARLLAGQREGESAMLTARGATRWQLLRMTTMEAVPLCLVSAAAGGVLGVLLARALASTSASAGDAWPAATAVAVGALVILLVPSLSTVTPGTARVRRGRQAAISNVSRAGVDLALIVLAVLAGWQLRDYSAVSAGSSGNFGVDPVIVIAPALALAGGTVVALRLLPAGGKAGDRLAARGRRLTAAMASWQISRQPLRQGGAALLIVLAVATCTLALSQRQSWTSSDHDQAAFSSGADVRVQTSQPLTAAQAGALVQTPGVQHAIPQPTGGAQTLAIDSGQAADVTLLRADQSSIPAASLFAKIGPTGPVPGVILPGPLAEVRVSARLGPASLGLAPVTVGLTVQDADGNVYQLDAGTLPADGRDHTLTASLGGGSDDKAIYPLRLTSIQVSYTMPAHQGAPTPAVLTVSSLTGAASLPGADLRGWSASAVSTELAGVRETSGTVGPAGPPSVSSASATGGALAVTFQPGYGLAPEIEAPPSAIVAQLTLAAAPAGAVVPGIATQGFLNATNASVGSTVHTDIDGAIFSVKIVAAVATFPTVSGGGALIVDLGTIQSLLTSSSLQPAAATQWWLATSSGAAGVPPGLSASLPAGSAVTSEAGVAAGLLGNPLSTVPQQALLAVALAAAVLAITGFCVSIAAGVRLRRAENALLAALGVAPRSAAWQLSLEKLMLSLPSALAGLVLGGVLAELLVPAITLTSSATIPVPPVLIHFGWALTLPLAVAVAVLPVLAAALTIARRPDAAAELRTAEAA